MLCDHIAIIPARSGSKGLRDKNIRVLNGKPMISYTIEAAINSGIYDYVYVSTDSDVYAEISKSYGAEIPFMRPNYLSSDSSSSNELIEYTIKKFNDIGMSFKKFSLLQPTSPLRNYKHIVEANDLFKDKNANSVVSVCQVEHSPLWCNIIREDLCIDNFINRENNRNRQNLSQYYRVNGAIYMSSVDYFLKYKYFYEEGSFAYIMDKESSVDIDDTLDFEFAEFLMSKKNR